MIVCSLTTKPFLESFKTLFLQQISLIADDLSTLIPTDVNRINIIISVRWYSTTPDNLNVIESYF